MLAWPEVYDHLPNVRDQLSPFQECKFLKLCFSAKPPPWNQAELILCPECFHFLSASFLPCGHWNLKKTPLELVPKTITSSSPPGLLPALRPCLHHFWVDRQRGWKMMATECHQFEGNTQPVLCLCDTWLFHNLCLRLGWIKATSQTWVQTAPLSVVQVLFWLVWVSSNPNHPHFTGKHSSKRQLEIVIYWDLDFKDMFTCKI